MIKSNGKKVSIFKSVNLRICVTFLKARKIRVMTNDRTVIILTNVCIGIFLKYKN